MPVRYSTLLLRGFVDLSLEKEINLMLSPPAIEIIWFSQQEKTNQESEMCIFYLSHIWLLKKEIKINSPYPFSKWSQLICQWSLHIQIMFQ